MKTSGVCPKCGGREIVAERGKLGPYGAGNAISVGPTVFQYVSITRRICLGCGYIEQWIDDEKDLVRLRKRFREG